jgi:hypothetical protein
MQTFRTFFHGQMSGLEITCLKSFLDLGHRVVVFAYDDTYVPDAFERADANQLLPRDRFFKYWKGSGKGSCAAFANQFRYLLLARYSDWWIDTDVLCLRADWPSATLGPVAGKEDRDVIGSAILALPKPLATSASDRCAQLGEDVVWGDTGPRLVTRLFQEHALLDSALPRSAFYPVHWRDWRKPFDPSALENTRRLCRGSFAVHLWHEMMRRSGFDKSWLPPADSFFGQAVLRHATAEHFMPVDPSQYRASLLAGHSGLRTAVQKLFRRR